MGRRERGASVYPFARGHAASTIEHSTVKRADIDAARVSASMPPMSTDVLRPLDVPRLTREFRSAEPFPFIVIDELLTPEFAREVSEAYPTFENALAKGFAFDFVNEKKKVQVTDASKFPGAVKRLNDAIQSQIFRDRLSEITGIPSLLADEALIGGGMHVMGSAGRLDVH